MNEQDNDSFNDEEIKKEKESLEVIIKQNNNDNITNTQSSNIPYINLTTSFSSFSEKEVQSLLQFKEYCASMGLEYRFDLYGNDIILRLLESRKYNIQETYKAFIEYINFTQKYDVFNIHKVKFPNFDKIRLFYPHGFHKNTYEGNPVFIQMLGELKIADINRLLPEPLLTQYILYRIVEVEKIIFPKCSEKFKKNINKIYCVVDLLGLSTSLMNKQIMDFINKLIYI